ncbi:TnsA-like heteromeric transposase endonuclease subunit [Streptomyces sp. B15]|uniref:TnsA-like heteromeric transposase endonuclease subunit n=1 Tax=Streptomyces sp. B15 TaxID=1537797 RepID=UPI001B380B34|nr:TnsA-like heteromeric transposase endonuclease subunit [Streptomyces sp. B15]MBQ1122744.1 TnsA-like heteromeric transposase endonuclease subunit [Streptomyces sp. B15]
MRTNAGNRLWSQSCTLDELFEDFDPECAALSGTDRWSTEWRIAGSDVVCSVANAGSVPLLQAQPVRQFSWRPRQRHRPGLQYLLTTGRHHGFESLEEQRFLLALDFAGRARDVLSQPLRLRFMVAGRERTHTPDFLLLLPDGCWLVDVRPRKLIKPGDVECFAAARHAAYVVGWRYSVVVGWLAHVTAGLEAMSAQRRPLEDRHGFERQLWEAAASESSFGELVGSTPLPVVARAHALHLLWHRHLGVDLSRPLDDGSTVVRGRRSP